MPPPVLEPRLRVLAALAGSVLMAAMQTVAGLGWAWLLAVVLGLTSIYSGRLLPALDLWTAARRLLGLNILTIFIWLTLPWQFHAAGGVAWSEEGAQQAMLISLRLNAIALWCLVWLTHLEPASLASALRSLGVSARLALLVYLSIRSLENLLIGHRRLQGAMRARAAPVRLWRRLQIASQLLVSLIVDGLHRADIFAAALRARGLDLQTGGLLLARAPWRTVPGRDVLLVALCLLALIVLGWGLA